MKPKKKAPKRKASMRAKKAFEIMVGNGGKIGPAMIEAGYSPNTADSPSKLTNQKSWKELMDEYLPETLVAARHKELLNATRIEHMVVPLGPDDAPEEGEELPEVELEGQPQGGALMRRHGKKDFSKLTDDEIREMFFEVGCTVRRIVHSEQCRHIYFWSADNRARKDAVDLAYKLRGAFAPEKKEFSGGLNLSALFDAASYEPNE